MHIHITEKTTILTNLPFFQYSSEQYYFSPFVSGNLALGSLYSREQPVTAISEDQNLRGRSLRNLSYNSIFFLLELSYYGIQYRVYFYEYDLGLTINFALPVSVCTLYM